MKTTDKNSKASKIASFDPNSPGSSDGNLYGLPFSEVESEVVIIPVPWEVTVSYSAGCAAGPDAILEASKQLDLYDPEIKDAWKMGIYMLNLPKKISKWNKEYRKKAEKYIDWYTSGSDKDEQKQLESLAKINRKSEAVNEWVRSEADRILKEGKIAAVVGGEHSSPLGLMQALGKKYKSYSILQVDAHCDLRNAYEGFENSHASIMHNALKIKAVEKLVQVGIRDYCQEEVTKIKAEKGRVKTYFDKELAEAAFAGKDWKKQCDEIVKNLGSNVYISFDIDGLVPYLCPNTGTPVAGGLEYNQAIYLIKRIVESGKKIIGFDLCEVAPGKDEWDGNVGARVLMRLANYAGLSQNKTGK